MHVLHRKGSRKIKFGSGYLGYEEEKNMSVEDDYLEVVHTPSIPGRVNPNCHCLFVLRENFCFSTDLLISTESVSKAHLWSILVLGWSALAETRHQSFRERQKTKAGLHKERERSYGGEIMPIPCKSQEVPKPVINFMSCEYCMTNMGISCPSKTFLEIPASPAPTTSYHKFSFLLPGLCLLVWCNTSGFLIPWVCWGLQRPTVPGVTLLIASSNVAGMTNTSSAFMMVVRSQFAMRQHIPPSHLLHFQTTGVHLVK